MNTKRNAQKLNSRLIVLVVATILATAFAVALPASPALAYSDGCRIEITSGNGVNWFVLDLKSSTMVDTKEFTAAIKCHAVMIQWWKNGKLLDTNTIVADVAELGDRELSFNTYDGRLADQVDFISNYTSKTGAQVHSIVTPAHGVKQSDVVSFGGCGVVIVDSYGQSILHNNRLQTVTSSEFVAQTNCAELEIDWWKNGKNIGHYTKLFNPTGSTNTVGISYASPSNIIADEIHFIDALGGQYSISFDPISTPIATPTPAPRVTCQLNFEYVDSTNMPHSMATFVEEFVNVATAPRYDGYWTNGDDFTMSSNCRTIMVWYSNDNKVLQQVLYDPSTIVGKFVVTFNTTMAETNTVAGLIQFITVPKDGPMGRQVVMLNPKTLGTPISQSVPAPVAETQDVTFPLWVWVMFAGVLVLIVSAVFIVSKLGTIVQSIKNTYSALTNTFSTVKDLEKEMKRSGADFAVVRERQLLANDAIVTRLQAMARVLDNRVPDQKGIRFVFQRDGRELTLLITTALSGSNATQKLQAFCRMLSIPWETVSRQVRAVYINGKDTGMTTCYHNFDMGDEVKIVFK